MFEICEPVDMCPPRIRSSLKVLYFGTYDESYPRNRIMIQGLRSEGVEVVECHAHLWKNTEEKVNAASTTRRWFSLAKRAAQSYARLLRMYWPLRRSYDAMMLGYTGQFDVFLARLLTLLAKRPLVLDVFVSIYLASFERGLQGSKLLRWVESIACRLPDMLIIDTIEYVEWFQHTYGISRTRFRLVPLGADNSVFKPLPRSEPDGTFRVLYQGKFIPLHGVEYIIQAADLLRREQGIRFELIGRGPMFQKAQALAADLGLNQVLFSGWLDQQALPARIAAADIVLGVFGTTEASNRTFPNKIYQALAMARPLVTGDLPAVRSVLSHGQNAYLVEPANPEALANAILALRSNPDLRACLADAGYRLYIENFTIQAIGRKTRQHLEELVCSWGK